MGLQLVLKGSWLQSLGFDGVGAFHIGTTLFFEIRYSEKQGEKSWTDFWIACIRGSQVCGTCRVRGDYGNVMPKVSSIISFHAQFVNSCTDRCRTKLRCLASGSHS